MSATDSSDEEEAERHGLVASALGLQATKDGPDIGCARWWRAGLLTQGGQGGSLRDCIGFLPWSLPIECAWDLMEVTCIWSPVAERKLSPYPRWRAEHNLRARGPACCPAIARMTWYLQVISMDGP